MTMVSDLPLGTTGFTAMGTFGELVKDLRERRDWSHDQLARVSGITKTQLINIEKHDRPRSQERTIDALAKAFGMKGCGDLVDLYRERLKEPEEAEAAKRLLRRELPLLRDLQEVAAARGQNWWDYLVELTRRTVAAEKASASRPPVPPGTPASVTVHHPDGTIERVPAVPVVAPPASPPPPARKPLRAREAARPRRQGPKRRTPALT
jgi:transcriptional regulator with XRE-family HTH domain